jgi:hypothetical protein
VLKASEGGGRGGKIISLKYGGREARGEEFAGMMERMT